MSSEPSEEISRVISVESTEDEDSSSWESMDEDPDPVQKLLGNSLILDNIFRTLSGSELRKCRLVCNQWNRLALMRHHLGCKSKIELTEENIDEFLVTAQKSVLPFCRSFIFNKLELGPARVNAFRRSFRLGLHSLTLLYCESFTVQPIINLLMCPNLKELKITGNLFRSIIEFPENLFRRKEMLRRLKHLELIASNHYGQVSQEVIRTILQHAPNLESICIGLCENLWRNFLEVADTNPNSRLHSVRLYHVEKPLNVQIFLDFASKLNRMTKCTFEECVVSQEFLFGVISVAQRSLEELSIIVCRSELLSSTFRDLSLPLISRLTLPVAGVSAQDGPFLLKSLPNLQVLNIVGVFKTKFTMRNSHLLSVSADSFELCNFDQRVGMSRTTSLAEPRKEFKRVLTLLPGCPKKFETSLDLLSNGCIRSIFRAYPDLEELKVLNNSRDCIDAWTGVPRHVCRKISGCRSFSVANQNRVQRLPSVASLKKLKRLELSIIGDPPKAEFTLIYILYGICQVKTLEDLRLTNVTMTDIAYFALLKSLNLNSCMINGFYGHWTKFKSDCANTKIRSFLLPPEGDHKPSHSKNPIFNTKILRKILCYLPHSDVFNARIVSKKWHSVATDVLHHDCRSYLRTAASAIDDYLDSSQKSNHSSPNKTPRQVLSSYQSTSFMRALQLLQDEPTINTLIVRGINKSLLECFQLGHVIGNNGKGRACEDKKRVVYWFYPDGRDELMFCQDKNGPKPTSITVMGSWTKKDSGLLEFLKPSFAINSVELIGLLEEVYDLFLPKLTAMQNVESITIKPFSNSCVTEITRSHLQILANSSFGLKNLSMQKLQAPPEIIADLIRSHRFTLEKVEIQNHVNVSDRLSFSIPHLKSLQLDEPPGTLLWTTLNINQNVKSIRFDRSGYVYNQVKSKAIPKLELYKEEFEHSAKEVLCDVNLFLECEANRRLGGQKSVLQIGSDSALTFFTHFRFLTSLTLRSVHAHYGMLQGIFRTLTQLEKLVLKNSAGITDEIITGFSKEIIDAMDLLNPLQFKNANQELNLEASRPSIRSLKRLVHLNLNDQNLCSDLSILFGIMRLKNLKYFSCVGWKITDVSVRALADVASIENVVVGNSAGVSSFGEEYFNNKAPGRLTRKRTLKSVLN